MENLAVLGPKPENISEKEPLIERYLTFFRRLRDDYSNEIPKEIIHSTDDNNKLKVRKAWFTVVVNELQMFAEDFLSDEINSQLDLLGDVNNFVVQYKDRKFQMLERVRPEDVEAGDAILDKVISYLENL